MRLLSLRMRNFMPFYGVHEIAFPVSDARNVIVVYGDNMRGKTSVLNAIRWAFYGKVLGRHLKPISRANILNKDAAHQRDFTVEVALRLEHAGAVYDLTRTMGPKDLIDTPRDDEHFELSPPGLRKDGSPISGHLVEHEINQIMPESISRFSLFDGELLQEYEQLVADATEESEEIKAAIERVLGVPTLLNARKHIGALLERAQHQFTKDGVRDAKERALLEKLNDEVEAANREVKKLEDLAETARGRVEECDEKLRRYANAESIKSHVEENRRQQNAAKGALDRAFQRRRELAPQAWLAIIDSTISARLDVLQQELFSEQERLVRFVEERALRQLKLRSLQTGNCGLCAGALSVSAKSEFQVDTRGDSPGEGLQEFSSRLNAATRQYDLLKKLAAPGIREQLVAVEREIDRCNVELVGLHEREAALLNEIPGVDLSELGRTRDQRDNWQRELAKMEQLLAIEIGKRNALVRKYDVAVRAAATSGQGASKLLGEKVTLLSSIAEVVGRSVESLRVRLRSEVERSATDTFKRLTTESQFRGLVINSRYGLEIRDHMDRPVSVRSAGAEQIVALSLIDGLNTAAAKSGPLIMDTPFGRLDVKHRAHVLEYLPKMAEQVVLLVHEGELSPERDYPHIAAHVGAVYEICRVSPTQSSIVPR